MPVQAINGRCLKCGDRLPLQSDRRRIIYSLAYIILFALGVSFATSSLAQSGGKATLVLKITGLRSEKGQVKSPYSIRPRNGSANNRYTPRRLTWTVKPSHGESTMFPMGIMVSRYFMMKTVTARWIEMFWGYL